MQYFIESAEGRGLSSLATLRFINHHDQTRSLAGHGAVRTHSKRIQKRIRSNARLRVYGVAGAMQRHGEADTVTLSKRTMLHV